MKTTRRQNLLAAALVGAQVATIAQAQQPKPKMATDIPPSIPTPDMRFEF